MNKEPVEGEIYDRKIIKMIPLKGETFSIEPNYKVKFKVLGQDDTKNNKEKEDSDKEENKQK